MKTIWKFPVYTGDVSVGVYGKREIEAPFGVEFIHVGHQNGELCLWGLVEDENTPESVTVYITGTGTPMPDVNLKYIGSSWQSPFMWHVWIEEKMPSVLWSG